MLTREALRIRLHAIDHLLRIFHANPIDETPLQAIAIILGSK